MTHTTSSWARVVGVAVLTAGCAITPFALVHHHTHEPMPGATITVGLQVPDTVCPGVPAPIVATVSNGGAKVDSTQAKATLQSTTVATPGANDWKSVGASFDSTGVATVKTPATGVPLHYRLTVDAMAGFTLSQTSPIVADIATPPANVFAACVPALGAPAVSDTSLVTGQTVHVTGTAYHPDWTSPSYDTSSLSSWAAFAGLPVQAVLTTTRTVSGKTTITSTVVGKGVAAADGTYDLPVKVASVPPAGATLELSVVSPASTATGPAVTVDAGAITVDLPNAPTLAVTTPASSVTLYAGEPLTISGTATGPVPTGATLTVKAGAASLGSLHVGGAGSWSVTGTVPSKSQAAAPLTIATTAVSGVASAKTFTSTQQVTLSMRDVIASGSATLTPAAPAHGAGFLVTGDVKVSGSSAVAMSGVTIGAWKINADGTLFTKAAVVSDTTDSDGSFVLRFTTAKSAAGNYVILATKGDTWGATEYDSTASNTTSLFHFTVS